MNVHTVLMLVSPLHCLYSSGESNAPVPGLFNFRDICQIKLFVLFQFTFSLNDVRYRMFMWHLYLFLLTLINCKEKN